MAPRHLRHNGHPDAIDMQIRLEQYEDESQLASIQRLMDADLSEPYSIFTYRYFINQWPYLCFLAFSRSACIGAIVSKLEHNKKGVLRGYIAMLAVDRNQRNLGIGSKLVSASIRAMNQRACEEVVLEAETSNKGALALYANLGFIRDKRLEKYYLSGNDAFRLKLRLTSIPPSSFRFPLLPCAKPQHAAQPSQSLQNRPPDPDVV